MAVDIDAVLSRVSCPDLCEELGIELDAHGRTPCFHDGLDAHQNRSVDVDERLFYCHRCGKGGTVIDLLMQATGCSFRKAVLQLEDFAENKPARVAKAEQKPAQVFTIANLNTSEMTRKHNEFRRKRYGSINWDPSHNVYPVEAGFAFCYPNIATGVGWEGVKFRWLLGGKASIPGSKFTHLWCARPGRHTAILCEGETDALALACYIDSNPYRGGNCAVYSLPSGAGNIKPSFLAELDSFGDVIVIMDNDLTGKDARDKIDRLTGWRWTGLNVPQLYIDAEDALHRGWDPIFV